MSTRHTQLHVSSLLVTCLLAAGPRLSATDHGAAGSVPALPAANLEFIENRGQWDAAAAFAAFTADGAAVFFTADGFRISLRRDDAPADRREIADLFFSFEGSDPGVALVPAAPTGQVRNYFVGPRDTWASGAGSFHELVYQGLYPGVDLHCHAGAGGHLEYDLRLAAGVDPAVVVLRCDGARHIEQGADDSLTIDTGIGTLRHLLPASWTIPADGTRRPCDVRLVRLDDQRFTFAADDRARDEALVIDPVLVASTLLGANYHDEARDVALDALGYVYVCGMTTSTNFPTSPGYKLAPFGLSDYQDGFLTKFTPDLSKRIYSTYYGSTGSDELQSVAVNGLSQACVAGCADGFWVNLFTASTLTEPTLGGSDILIGMFSANGQALVAGGIIPLPGRDEATGVAFVDADTFAITGTVDQGGLTQTAGTYDPTYNDDDDAFVMLVDVGATAVLNKATYLGGVDEDDGRDIAFAANSLFITGHTQSGDFRSGGTVAAGNAYDTTHNGAGTEDAFVARFTTGLALQYVTFLGGLADDRGMAIAVDASGIAYVAGETHSTSGFPATNTAYLHNPTLTGRDAFVGALTASGTGLLFMDRFGGDDADRVGGLTRDGSGALWVVGRSSSTNYPLLNTLSAYQGGEDMFATRFNTLGSLLFSTFLGGSAKDDANGVAAAGPQAIVMAGLTQSAGFPTTPFAYQRTPTTLPEAAISIVQACNLAIQAAPDCGGATANGPLLAPIKYSKTTLALTNIAKGITPYLTVGLFAKTKVECPDKPFYSLSLPLPKVLSSTGLSIDVGTLSAPFLCGRTFRLQAHYQESFGWVFPPKTYSSNALLVTFD